MRSALSHLLLSSSICCTLTVIRIHFRCSVFIVVSLHRQTEDAALTGISGWVRSVRGQRDYLIRATHTDGQLTGLAQGFRLIL